jgi:hypothetical protein
MVSYLKSAQYFTLRRPLSGERTKIYTCCQRPVADGGGCSHGPHVFYETEPALLHARHAFTTSASSAADAKGKARQDLVALDCEMVYTTGGFRVARVSVVDGAGKEIFDEYVKMDDDVLVVCVVSLPLQSAQADVSHAVILIHVFRVSQQKHTLNEQDIRLQLSASN